VNDGWSPTEPDPLRPWGTRKGDEPWRVYRAGRDDRALPVDLIERTLAHAQNRWVRHDTGRKNPREAACAPSDLKTAITDAAADGLQGWTLRELRLTRNLLRLGPSDYHTPHTDYGGRCLTAVAMLSEPSDYDGGTLELHTDRTHPIPLGRGDIVVFPSSTLHSVSPITRGERVTVVVLLKLQPLR
jgi:hypothetical protein